MPDASHRRVMLMLHPGEQVCLPPTCLDRGGIRTTTRLRWPSCREQAPYALARGWRWLPSKEDAANPARTVELPKPRAWGACVARAFLEIGRADAKLRIAKAPDRSARAPTTGHRRCPGQLPGPRARLNLCHTAKKPTLHRFPPTLNPPTHSSANLPPHVPTWRWSSAGAERIIMSGKSPACAVARRDNVEDVRAPSA